MKTILNPNLPINIKVIATSCDDVTLVVDDDDIVLSRNEWLKIERSKYDQAKLDMLETVWSEAKGLIKENFNEFKEHIYDDLINEEAKLLNTNEYGCWELSDNFLNRWQERTLEKLEEFIKTFDKEINADDLYINIFKILKKYKKLEVD